MGTVPTPGVVNSLQLLPAPKGFLDNALWAGSDSNLITQTGAAMLAPNGKASTVKRTGIEALLLVAGLGQEHRLGRWLTVKGDGAVNSTVVMAFRPR